MSDIQKNVLGEDLELCGSNPITGYLRDEIGRASCRERV